MAEETKESPQDAESSTDGVAAEAQAGKKRGLKTVVGVLSMVLVCLAGAVTVSSRSPNPRAREMMAGPPK